MLRVPDMKIVISSTWRHMMELDEFKDYFKSLGLDSSRLIGYTPCCVSGDRGHEINLWLEEHPEVDIVILDDNDDMADKKAFLVQTSGKEGLTKEKAEEIIKRFEKGSYGKAN